MKKIYLAGPISGLDWKQATEWRQYVEEELSDFGIECLSPLRFKSFLSSETSIRDSYPDHALANTRAIYTRDRWDVSRSDVILVNFVGATKVSIGTVIEIAWADMLNKPIIYLAEDDNIHNHAMVMESIGFRAHTIEEAVDVAKALLIVD